LDLGLALGRSKSYRLPISDLFSLLSDVELDAESPNSEVGEQENRKQSFRVNDGGCWFVLHVERREDRSGQLIDE
jgi:hypothetical protein